MQSKAYRLQLLHRAAVIGIKRVIFVSGVSTIVEIDVLKFTQEQLNSHFQHITKLDISRWRRAGGENWNYIAP